MLNRDIAVVGLACVFPDAADLSAYWRNLVNGVDAIRDLPPERWAGSRNLDLPPGHAGHIACVCRDLRQQLSRGCVPDR